MSGWADQLLLLGVGTARIACAFAMLPLFANETVPALVRNSIFIGMGLISLALQPPFHMQDITAAGWLAIFAKEAFVGLVIGFFFGSVLWALEAAGQIIDSKVGATTAQIVDPLSGNQESLNGAFLARLANIVFIFSGGLSLIVRVLIESYALWPIAAPAPALDPRGLELFEAEFGRMMVLAVLFAAPVLVVLFMIDLALGLMNRFAQQLNVFSLSLSIKAFAATLVILMLLSSYVLAIARDVQSRPAVLHALLEHFGR